MKGLSLALRDVGAAARRSHAVAPPDSWLRERIWLWDLLVAIGVFLYNLPFVPIFIDFSGQVFGLLLVSLVLCGLYLLRRRYPLAVLAVMLLAVIVQQLLGVPILMADAILLFGLYNVASRYNWWVSAPAAVAVVAWLLVTVVPRLGDEFIDIGQLGVLVVVVVWVWTWGTLVRIRRGYVAGLAERAEHVEREREAQTRIAVADERARIAREIHDIVAHGLSVVVLVSDGAASKVESEPVRARQAMLTVRDTGRSSLAEMRRMLGVLRDGEPGSQAPQPGIADLERLVEESNAAGLPTVLTVEGDPIEVPGSVGLAVFRVVQEALTNTRKHAGPGVSRADVWLRYHDDRIEGRVADDGAGAATGPVSGGHGLVGMRERVAAHGGTLTAGSRPGGTGFEVTAVLPTGEES